MRATRPYQWKGGYILRCCGCGSHQIYLRANVTFKCYKCGHTFPPEQVLRDGAVPEMFRAEERA